MLQGALIMESLREDARLDDLDLRIRELYRFRPASATPPQSELWSVIEFQAPDDAGGRLAEAFSAVLLKPRGWYVDFRSEAETFVVFADQVFRYPRGDAAGRAAAVEYGRAAGVPESQLDWPV